jgi:hypothetical protein
MTRIRIILIAAAVAAFAFAGVTAYALRTPKSGFDGASIEGMLPSI